MKKFSKIVSVVLAVMFVFTAMACFASAETTVIKNNSCLNSTGSAGDTITKFQGARDIYLVLDVSGSMSGEPLAALKQSAKDFCKTMLEDTTGDNRIAIVTYGSDVESYAFSTNYDSLAEIIDGFEAKGSTAMYDALIAVKDSNETIGNADATKHVVVMADGLPNEGAVLSNGKYTSKDSTMYYKYGNAVYSVASGMWHEFNIYSIGFFHNLGGSQLKYGKVLLKDIQNALYLEIFDADELLDAFTGIADDILDKNCNCDNNCACGENCNCGDNCTCDKAPCADADDDGGCKCVVECVCGDDCDCGDVCKCNELSNNNGNGNDNGDNGTTDEITIPQTGDSSVGIAAAAVFMMAGIAVLASKKRED